MGQPFKLYDGESLRGFKIKKAVEVYKYECYTQV